VIHLTPKALRLNQLRADGMAFETALAQADREFSDNGWARRPAPGVISGELTYEPVEYEQIEYEQFSE
jgi:hypothetical protein